MQGVQWVESGTALPPYDCHCPLMSLPGVFGVTADSLPADVPYLGAEAAIVDRWRARIGPSGFRIGIAWQGNPTAFAERGRSTPLAAFAPLARIPGVRLISLQKVHGLDQLNDLPSGMRVAASLTTICVRPPRVQSRLVPLQRALVEVVDTVQVGARGCP